MAANLKKIVNMSSSNDSSAPAPRVEWSLLSGKDLKRPGAALMNLILAAASHRGIGAKDIGEASLGIGYPHFAALRSGKKHINKLGEEHLAHCAEFLKIPLMAVLMAAGQRKPADFDASPVTFEGLLVPAFRQMQSHPELGAFIPTKILKMETAVQKCVFQLFQAAVQKEIIPAPLLAAGPNETNRPENPVELSTRRKRLEWNLMSDGELNRPGAVLISQILWTAADRAIPSSKIGQRALRSSPTYWNSLRKGIKPVTGLGPKHVEKAAEFLGTSVMYVLFAAGRRRLEDFYPSPTSYHNYLMPALQHVLSDPQFGPAIPKRILNADIELRKCIVFLYEQATGQVLIPGRVTLEELVTRQHKLVNTSLG